MFIDTHSHLYSSKFKEDIETVISNAVSNDIVKILLPNIDIDSIAKMHDLQDAHSSLFESMMGIHPCYVSENHKQELDTAHQWFSKRNYCAVGEIGIDLYWDKTLIKAQEISFRAQLKWAKELDLPVVIHARDSFEEIFKIVDEENSNELRGVFHCFTGGAAEAEKIINYGGFKMGVGGVLTFKKSGLDKTIADIPMDHLVLETDSPYLAPSPHRGKRNESAFLIHIAEKLAEVKNISLKEVSKITTHNAVELFQLDL